VFMSNSEYVICHSVFYCNRYICQRATKLWRRCNISVLYELNNSLVLFISRTLEASELNPGLGINLHVE
jgi:hypothetical protein